MAIIPKPVASVGAAIKRRSGYRFGFWISQTVEVRIRYCGLGFELAGIVTVALGLEDRRRLFDRPNPFQLTWDRLKQWWSKWWRPKNHVFTPEPGEYLTTGLSAKASVWRIAPSGSSLDERVSVLESNIASLRNEEADISKAIQEETRKRGEAQASECQAREAADNTLMKKLQELGAGSLQLEWLGIVWLLLGVILATTSSEIASAINRPTSP